MLELEFCKKHFKNPIMAASGTFGFGDDFKEYFDIERLGGFSTTGITYYPKEGNKGTRIMETSSGMLNSIGLENEGLESFVENRLEALQSLDTNVLVNLGGNSFQEYIEAAEILEKNKLEFLELNISCPNVKKGGMAFGMDPELAYDLISQVRKVYGGVLIVKLSPNADVKALARAAERAGADGISLVNTFTGMAIDIDTRRAVFENKVAGLSGPCIKPIALRMVYEVSKTVDIPIIGIGGIRDYRDVLEFIMAGASLVQVGSMNFVKPDISMGIIRDLENYMIDNKLKSLDEIRGII